ncbi:MAG: hypothetical protein M3170_01215 [Candidatus Dormibacteraeota bacterium]|nr:hypothetical protein [Candidatus Dormibacteraeota bacterium]
MQVIVTIIGTNRQSYQYKQGDGDMMMNAGVLEMLARERQAEMQRKARSRLALALFRSK